jgi:hypothetical protein
VTELTTPCTPKPGAATIAAPGPSCLLQATQHQLTHTTRHVAHARTQHTRATSNWGTRATTHHSSGDGEPQRHATTRRCEGKNTRRRAQVRDASSATHAAHHMHSGDGALQRHTTTRRRAGCPRENTRHRALVRDAKSMTHACDQPPTAARFCAMLAPADEDVGGTAGPLLIMPVVCNCDCGHWSRA